MSYSGDGLAETILVFSQSPLWSKAEIDKAACWLEA